MSGYSRQELLNMSIFDLLHPLNLENFNGKNDLVKSIREIENNSIEITIKNICNAQIILEGRLLIINGNKESVEIQGVFQDVTAKKEAENRIYYLSYHDKLTDLYNRAYFDEILEKLDNNEEFPYCLIMGDINGLKKTNDLFGHKAGDKLIQIVAEILKKSCRESDIVARIGGDEFAIILPKCSMYTAKKICDRIKKACNSYCNGSPVKPDIALGYSIKKDHSKSNDILISEADSEMYKAKFNNK